MRLKLSVITRAVNAVTISVAAIMVTPTTFMDAMIESVRRIESTAPSIGACHNP
nr:hypothetical protein [Nitrosospira sp. Nsp11]